MKILFLLAMIVPILSGNVKADPAILPDPLPAHPRLLVRADDWEKLRHQVETDPLSRRVFDLIKARTDRMLDQPPVERKLEGRRLLQVSRLALERITALAMVARITGDERYSRRAVEEMIAVTRFSDWNPSHFLDVAEMALAVAIGYDWLYDDLTPEQRDEIARALLEKGIRPSFVTPEPFFVRGTNNWNQVCHAGMSAAAIAIADREPALAGQVLERAIRFLPNAAESYAPDGAFLEGPMYWDYGTTFHVVLAAALERLTGSTQGIADYPGFAASADYVQQVTTPLGLYFCYSDCRPKREMQLPLFWFARHFHRPDWIASNIGIINAQHPGSEGKLFDGGRLFPLALLWLLPSDGAPATHATAPVRWYGRGKNPLVVVRSSYADPSALYFAIKGGGPLLSHAHMDAGSFNLTTDGVEWATDLGMQEYESLEKLNIPIWDRKGGRWDVFRLGPESHNIPRFNGTRPLIAGEATFRKVQLDGENPSAILDLTSLYQDQVMQAERGAMVLNDKAVLIQDEWKGSDQETAYSWQFLTRAEIQVTDGKVRLTKDGKSLDLLILDRAPAQINVEKAEDLMKAFDAPNPGVKRVSICLSTAPGQDGRLRVLAVPGSSGVVDRPSMQPLADWK